MIILAHPAPLSKLFLGLRLDDFDHDSVDHIIPFSALVIPGDIFDGIAGRHLNRYNDSPRLHIPSSVD